MGNAFQRVPRERHTALDTGYRLELEQVAPQVDDPELPKHGRNAAGAAGKPETGRAVRRDQGRVDNPDHQAEGDHDRLLANVRAGKFSGAKAEAAEGSEGVELHQGSQVRAIPLSGTHRCGRVHASISINTRLWVWGSNSTCQHGIKDDELKEQTEKIGKYIYFPDMELEPSTWPTQVSMFTIQQNRRITYMATGYEYIVVVENRRSVFSWGRNLKGQCGLGHVSETVAVPTKIQDLEGMLVQ